MTKAAESVVLAKALPPDQASKFVYAVEACTEVIGGNPFDTKYAIERLLIDPLAVPEDGALVVAQLCSNALRMNVWTKRRGGKFALNGIVCDRDDIDVHVRILGRVVGFDRHFPRDTAAYSDIKIGDRA
jgi:hypothetical protein